MSEAARTILVADDDRAIRTVLTLALARLGQPIVLYMPMSQLGEVSAALQKGGMAAATPAALIQSATLPDERVVESTLGDLVADAERSGLASPAILVIGAVAGLRRQILSSLVGWT